MILEICQLIIFISMRVEPNIRNIAYSWRQVPNFNIYWRKYIVRLVFRLIKNNIIFRSYHRAQSTCLVLK